MEQIQCELCEKGTYLAQNTFVRACTDEECRIERVKLMEGLKRVIELGRRKRQQAYLEAHPALQFEDDPRPSMQAIRTKLADEMKKCLVCRKNIRGTMTYCNRSCKYRARTINKLRTESKYFSQYSIKVIDILLDNNVNSDEDLILKYKKGVLPDSVKVDVMMSLE